MYDLSLQAAGMFRFTLSTPKNAKIYRSVNPPLGKGRQVGKIVFFGMFHHKDAFGI
jgi:hypothetical protein